MDTADCTRVSTADLIDIARDHLRECRVSLLVGSREQALSIIYGLKPPPPRKSPLNFKPYVPQCVTCSAPLLAGALCDTVGTSHLNCKEANV